MFQLPDLERPFCSPNLVPPMLTLVMAATVISWMPWKDAGAAGGGEAGEAGTGPQESSRPGNPHSMLELRRQLLEYGQHRRGPRQGSEPVRPETPRAQAARSSGSSLPAAPAPSSAAPSGPASGPSSGLSSYSLTNLLTITHATPIRGPLTSPLTLPLSEALSEPPIRWVGSPPAQERRPAPGRGAELHLSDHERALLRQQLREVLRAPTAR